MSPSTMGHLSWVLGNVQWHWFLTRPTAAVKVSNEQKISWSVAKFQCLPQRMQANQAIHKASNQAWCTSHRFISAEDGVSNAAEAEVCVVSCNLQPGPRNKRLWTRNSAQIEVLAHYHCSLYHNLQQLTDIDSVCFCMQSSGEQHMLWGYSGCCQFRATLKASWQLSKQPTTSAGEPATTYLDIYTLMPCNAYQLILHPSQSTPAAVY